ncbi:anaerobic ribonucleoside-triphosphate reductase activating protein [Proteiniphilum sp. X52]|uniref:anaerobic ribonucleoside-triphosphate reductase activating protein n=1 Tax=Proteiniphilum sp. X52 TaxID=2382159 RepID=UPI000F09EE85|nr:anaerobic ribonucleoside-triphosphate reductase activating protein [Proteiniphilum sp. X52]RNC64477.1 anaerobic ribonucleoside-triphosphate reductase activating protein [Proteiniphilum sp. X52]
MLKYVDYDIVFQEIPDEVTLAVNLSNCPYRCRGCHSPHLQQDIGKELSESALAGLLQSYERAVTCICFMGGDADTGELYRLADFVRKSQGGRIKTAWYSGNDKLPENSRDHFDFVKSGPYVETLGGLNKSTTNQRLYRIEDGKMIDITHRMHSAAHGAAQ